MYIFEPTEVPCERAWKNCIYIYFQYNATVKSIFFRIPLRYFSRGVFAVSALIYLCVIFLD